MNEQVAPPRVHRVLWFGVACEAVVVYTSLRSGDYPFAAHALALACLFALLAWRAEPPRGTTRAKVMWGLVTLSAIFLAAAMMSRRE